ncbi:GNAT family N-acetyltransferase [Paenibacillus gansuensis]|uniref:GNAT family N-acetyltransferase n=1 Tax=Paenibacillus gansuensis TaxID=306542 RepID=A0ABW5P9J5_9BACL
MSRAGNYKTFVALLENQVVGSVHKDFQRHRVGTELLRYTENYAKDSGISSIILCTGMKRTDAHAF